MRAVIISSGSITNYEYIKSHINTDDTIICADGGYDHAKKMGITPNILIGDFDSITEIPDDIPCMRHPSEKNLTDTELAIEYARNKGFKNFLLLASTGSRMDHTLTNILLLKTFVEQKETAVIINENNKIMMIDSQIIITEPPDTIISLIPITNCTGVTTTNLKYPLTDATMHVGKGVGISNIILDDNATISVKSGLLIITVSQD